MGNVSIEFGQQNSYRITNNQKARVHRPQCVSLRATCISYPNLPE